MDLNQLANLGEFIGGVAVLVTLIVLLFQIRANSRLLEVQTLQASAAGRQRISLSFLGPETHATLDKMYSEKPVALDVTDWTTAEAYFEAYLSVAQCDFLVGGRGAAFQEYWDGSLAILRSLTSTPHFLVWWNSVGKGAYSERFAVLVEGIANEQANQGSYATRMAKALDSAGPDRNRP